MTIPAFDRAAMAVELIADEGMRLLAYDDASGGALESGAILVGHPTIGVGRTLDIKGLSHIEVRFLLANDINEHLLELSPCAWFNALDPVRQRAVVNMVHQLGVAGVLGFRDMIAAIERCAWADAAAAGLASRWAIETPGRAGRVMRQLQSGDGS